MEKKLLRMFVVHVFIICCLLETVKSYEYIRTLSREANALIEDLEADSNIPINGNTGYWKLHTFSAGDPVSSRARCLDGSYAGFWFEGGSGDGRKKFVVHHMGGGSLFHACFRTKFIQLRVTIFFTYISSSYILRLVRECR